MGSPPGPPSSLRSGWPSVLGTRRVLSWSPGRDLRGPGTQQAVLWGVRYWPLAHLTHLAAPCERETKLETTDPGRAGPVKSTGSRQRPGGHQALSRTLSLGSILGSRRVLPGGQGGGEAARALTAESFLWYTAQACGILIPSSGIKPTPPPQPSQ